jgi:hypothetical protein
MNEQTNRTSNSNSTKGKIMTTSTSTLPTLSTPVTPYRASKIINEVLSSHNLPSIPPQMIYNYTTSRINQNKTPLIPTTIINNQVLVTPEGLLEWIKKYLAKKTS